MNHNRYLLYIDVLGFRSLVEKHRNRVDDLFEIVASLNVYRHGSFSAIAFSDTILVHNVLPPTNTHDHEYCVMYQCEFFQDLMHRLAGRSIALRAVLTYGSFHHYRLNNIPFFYGRSLNRAYDEEKHLQLTGLVMDNHCQKYSKVFKCRRLNKDWHYVFVTQALSEWESYEAMIPIPGIVIDDTGLGWNLGPEIETLRYSFNQSQSHDPKVRKKHLNTLRQYEFRYPKCMKALRAANFMMEKVSDNFEWAKVRERMKENYSWASIRRPALKGSWKREKA